MPSLIWHGIGADDFARRRCRRRAGLDSPGAELLVRRGLAASAAEGTRGRIALCRGNAGGSFSGSPADHAVRWRVSGIAFAGLCTLNCISIAFWERELDESAGKGFVCDALSRSRPASGKALRSPSRLGSGVAAIVYPEAAPIFACVSVSSHSSGVARFFARKIDRDQRTALADLVLLTPLLALFGHERVSFDALAPWYRTLEWIAFGDELQRCRVACLGEIASAAACAYRGRGEWKISL